MATQLELLQSATTVSATDLANTTQEIADSSTVPAQYQQNIDTIQSDFDARVADIDAQRAASSAEFSSEIDRIRTEYTENRLNPDELLGDLRTTYQTQIGAVSNAYNAQVAREAERVDALIAGGSLGGNAYRAYQAHSTSSRELLGQAMGQIAQMSISAEESLASAGVSIATANADLFSQVSQTVSSLVAAQASSALNYSQLLSQTEIAAQDAISNMYSLALSERQLAQQLVLETRSQDIQLELGYLQANTQIQLQLMNNMSYMSGSGTLNTAGNLATSSERSSIYSIYS